jgi:RHS repeat-associated protein
MKFWDKKFLPSVSLIVLLSVNFAQICPAGECTLIKNQGGLLYFGNYDGYAMRDFAITDNGAVLTDFAVKNPPGVYSNGIWKSYYGQAVTFTYNGISWEKTVLGFSYIQGQFTPAFVQKWANYPESDTVKHISSWTMPYELYGKTCADFGLGKSCSQKEAEWKAANCQGRGKIFESYDCETNTGVCKLCDIKITDFSGSDTVISPKSGGSISFYYNAEGAYDSVELSVAGQTLLEGSLTWNGKYLSGPKTGKVVEPDTYSANLKVWDSDNSDCKATDNISFTVKENPKNCSFNVDFGSSANVASGNLDHSQALFSTPGAGLTTDLSLYYNSTDPYNDLLGTGWNHSYGISLTEQSGGDLLLRTGNGSLKLYKLEYGIYFSPEGDYSVLVKNSDNSFTLSKKDGREYLFSAAGLLQSITDRNGNFMAFAYVNNLLATITDSAGRVTGFTYDENSKLTAITGPDGKTYSFKVIDEMLAWVTYPDGGSWDYTYDQYGFMLSKVDPAGYTTTYTYDEEYRVKTATDPEGSVRTLNYPTADEETVKTSALVDKDGTIWQYSYDTTSGDLLEKVDPQGNVTSYTYDNKGNTLTKTGPDGLTITYTYDALGNRTSSTDPADATTTYTYNAYGQTTSITDSQGGTTTYTYDERGNQTAATDSAGNTTNYQYDAQGRITSITNPVGQISSMTYDAYGNIATMTDATGNTTTLTYDTTGQLTNQRDSLGNATTFEYDNSGNMTKVTDPRGNISTYSYDANGNRTTTTDANGNTTYSTYNYKGQVISTTDALGNTTAYNYGSSGCSSCAASPDKLTSLTDANDNTTTFVYDTLGRLSQEINSQGKITSYTYNVSGNMTSRTDGSGNLILYSYDSLGRLLTKTYPDQTATSFTYDAKGNMLTAANQDIGYTMQYDSQGRLTMVIDSNGKTISYGYDTLGNRTTMTNPTGDTITYSYDTGNRLRGINSWAGEMTFAYDDLGRRTALGYPNKVTTTYDYDSLGNLTRLIALGAKDEIVTAFTYSHDQVGNRLSKAMPDKRYDYNYDAIYRLLESSPVRINRKGKEIEDKNNAEEFSYDPVGNRISGPNWWDSYLYDKSNQMLESAEYDYHYDTNGNLIEKIGKGDELSNWTYDYDYENRLVKATKYGQEETKVISFKYDPFNRRIEKLVEEFGIEDYDSKTFTYVYDGANLIIEIETGGDGSGKEKASRYVYGLGTSEPLAIEQKGEVYYYHLDGLNTPTAMTDQKGRVVVSYEYSAFGERKHYGDKVKQYLTFPGQYYDVETGLHYNWNRYYDPETGRYITADPIGLDGGLNLYLYAGANPVNFVDPLGLYCGSGWNEYLVPDKPCGYDFSNCCKKHDECYGCEGEKAGKTKQQCDNEFYGCMKNVCSSSSYTSQNLYASDEFWNIEPQSLGDCQRAAKDYYWAVTKYGNKAFKKARSECCDI